MIHVFVVGSKGIPAKYGGFETFVENLTARKEDPEIRYHISCMGNEKKNFIYNNAECFNVTVPLTGALGRILHVSLVLSQVEKWCKIHPKEKKIVYILGCRIGFLIRGHARRLKKLGVKIYCNPDGLEWKRAKWSTLEKKILRFCEMCLVKYSDEVICDSRNIEEYILNTYPEKKEHTSYISYGAEVGQISCNDNLLQEWYDQFSINSNEYYLVVGRFVPENNYSIILREFVNSHSTKDLVIITNLEKNSFYIQLARDTGFQDDSRIKFVGTVYDQQLLKRIRENAFGYIHGHEVGGTNPSLLEALASTQVNLVLDVTFNNEVAQDAVLYWTKQEGSLVKCFEEAEELSNDERKTLGNRAKTIICTKYNWGNIVLEYERKWKREYQ